MMKTRNAGAYVVLAALFAGAMALSPAAGAADGLLIIAHGSPMPVWNKPVLELGEKASKLSAASGFKGVRTAMLEFAKPDVAGAVAELEKEGCDRIVAVPLFIAPSSHSHFDVPAVLGMYASEDILAALKEEGCAVAQPKVPIVLTPTLSEGDVLPRFALDQVRKLSTDPANEALVLVAHGDPGHHELNDAVMRRVATYCCGQTGIDDADWAFVAVGQTYVEHGLPAIAAASERKQRVLVVGIYLSLTADRLHKRMIDSAADWAKKPLEGKDIVFSNEAVVSHPATAQWIVDSANGAVRKD